MQAAPAVVVREKTGRGKGQNKVPLQKVGPGAAGIGGHGQTEEISGETQSGLVVVWIRKPGSRRTQENTQCPPSGNEKGHDVIHSDGVNRRKNRLQGNTGSILDLFSLECM